MTTYEYPQTTVKITPWHDPMVDRHGHDARSAYVETYWLGVIGPSATWILRRFADGLDSSPRGFRVDLAHMAATMGLSYARGPASPFGRALQRCVMFGLAQRTADGYAVRQRVPQVSARHLRRLPPDLAIAHDAWVRAQHAAESTESIAAAVQ